jgi:quercetin dioxygenase-like cupin family protein
LLQFDVAAETEQLRQEDPWRSTARNAKNLVKYADLRIVLIAKKAGTLMEGHKADGSISIHTLTGKLRLQLSEQTVELPAGRLLTQSANSKSKVRLGMRLRYFAKWDTSAGCNSFPRTFDSSSDHHT